LTLLTKVAQCCEYRLALCWQKGFDDLGGHRPPDRCLCKLVEDRSHQAIEIPMLSSGRAS
jgi:hypothetical protein